MGIFLEADRNEFDLDMDTLIESYIVDDLIHNYDADTIKEFCAPGGVGEALVEAKVLGKRTLVRLSKKDDLDRRQTIAAFQMAREKNDPLWNKLVQYQAKRKEIIAQIKNKYASKSQRAAIQGQKEYIKTMRKVPKSFMKAGGAERL